jgi:hypothetical protein
MALEVPGQSGVTHERKTRVSTMSDSSAYTIGAEVACQDGVCGDLRRVVVDPIKRVLTHLVVEPRHRRSVGHLVPTDLVDTAGETIQLRCTLAQFEALEVAEETQFLPGTSGYAGYDPGQVSSWPYYGLSIGMGFGGVGVDDMGGSAGSAPHVVTYDKVPVGEVEVRRGEHVRATDGPIGRVRGLIVDPSDHHVTHVLLDEGHIWGKKEVAIPISAVTRVDLGIQVNLTKDEVRDLPPVEADYR